MAAGLCLASAAWAAAGCGDGKDASPRQPAASAPAATSPSLTPSASPTQPSLGLVGKDDCLANKPLWAPISCGDGQAVAKVVGLGLVTNAYGTGSALSSCPAETDEILQRPDGGVGYFCLRMLRPPHLARPGLGGGIVVVGDCLVRKSGGYVETPCAGGGKRPEYKIVDIIGWKEGSCPEGGGRVQLSPDRLGLTHYCAKRM